MAWSPQQDAALRAVTRWLRDPRGTQVFRLFGFAGTGKTTLAKQIAADSGRVVQYAAFTGKAASVLRSKGCDGARTLHSLCYRLRDDDKGKPIFELNEDSDLNHTGLLILDECSMVGPELGADVVSFGMRVLVLGDPMQLPPILGTGFFDDIPADVMLTEIHRQAAENPIIRMATTVREGGRLLPGQYGASEVIAPRGELDAERVMAADQVLVGRNVTRRSANGRMRELRGIKGSAPTSGEKLVCLKNDREKGTLNGTLWSVDTILCQSAAAVEMMVRSDTGTRCARVKVPMPFFLGTEDAMDWRAKKHVDQFGFGYALTVHKSQGSQWDDVILFDESVYFRENRARHLYTGLTRAAEKVVVVQ